MSGILVAIVSDAKSAPLTSQVSPEWLARAAAACWTQLLRDVIPVWGAEVAGVRATTRNLIRPGESVFAILDELPDAPGAIAYHDVVGGAVPVEFLALSTCRTLDDVSTAISHELCEVVGDPDCNRWDDDGIGHEWAHELCDAVESNLYPIDMGDGAAPVMVSDFLLPAFFASLSPGPYCYTQANQLPGSYPIAPFKTAGGGYQITRNAGTIESQVQGDMRLARRVKGRHWSSRVFRRAATP